jgi:hypothetical protein
MLSHLWELKRKDVVDVNSFFNAWRLTRDPVGFRYEDRPAEPVVAVSFRKATGCETYFMPASEFKKLMRTNLVPLIT